MNQKDAQLGITLSGFLALMIGLSAAVILVFRITPVYLEYYSVKQALHALPSATWDNAQQANMPQAIRSRLQRYFTVNRVTSVNPSDITISQDYQNYFVKIRYEARVHLVANIDLLIHFSDQVMVQTNGS